jgi:hypothetical protein
LKVDRTSSFHSSAGSNRYYLQLHVRLDQGSNCRITTIGIVGQLEGVILDFASSLLPDVASRKKILTLKFRIIN